MCSKFIDQIHFHNEDYHTPLSLQVQIATPLLKPMTALVLDTLRYLSALYVDQAPQSGKEVLYNVNPVRFAYDTVSLTLKHMDTVMMEQL